MIHYHGGPITPDADAARILAGRHAMVSFVRPEQLRFVADICQTFCLDNGAFTVWRQGGTPDWERYYDFVEAWGRHPAFDWAVIPDSIDGGEDANDELLIDWPFPEWGVPVWHLHESLDRLDRLSVSYSRIALGSSGQYATVDTELWWHRIAEAMEVLCDEIGRPRVKLHGLRMLSQSVFSKLPLASADSTNVAQNIGIDGRWNGAYSPANKAARGIVLAERIERFQSAARWTGTPLQVAFALEATT